MRLTTWCIGLLGILLAITLTACAGRASAPEAIQEYIQARAQSDVDEMINLSCPGWEAQARIEATSFAAMNAVVEGMACQEAGAEGGATLVSCQGKIVTTYNGEAREWSLSDHQFRVISDDGEWRMCGYQ
ncbi:MAG: hypothetical protein ACRDH2_19640 [Anaerolineales bacterium]